MRTFLMDPTFEPLDADSRPVTKEARAIRRNLCKDILTKRAKAKLALEDKLAGMDLENSTIMAGYG